MEPHNHPEYERTFERVANILEAFAGRLDQQSRNLDTLTDIVTDLARSSKEVRGGLEELRDIMRQHITEARERDAETTDKLDALNDLMDRHVR